MEVQFFPVPANYKDSAIISEETYERLYAQSIDDPDGFWAQQAERLHWFQPYEQVKQTHFSSSQVDINWFAGGKLNVAYNCIDRHLAKHAQRTAIIWEGDEENQQEYISYQQLHDEVGRIANGLKARGVKKGDRVIIYMPMIPQATYIMLACARIGAIHSVVFGGFSPNAIAGRIEDCGASVIVTADEGIRGGRKVALKANVDEALTKPGTDTIESVIVFRYTGCQLDWNDARDVYWQDLVAEQSTECEPEWMDSEDPLFILYTSGSTGKPKGLVHTTAGYLLYAAITHQYIFDYNPDDIYWCAADVGWITGHSYIVYGPLANCATTLMFEGVPTYPDSGRIGRVVDKHKVNILYTAPTAIRALMAKGDEPTATSTRASLRLLGSVGEPINPEAWHWYYQHIGNGKCPIMDTWWQTETGGVMITPLAGAVGLKPGSATKPFFGVKAVILDTAGNEMAGAAEGNLAISASWPGQARTVWNNHARFIETYFSQYDGYYFTGDGAKRDEDDYFWITGRVDDVLNVSGHRLGTAEIESSLVAHEAIAEAAVVGYPHDIKGQGIYAYLLPNDGVEITPELTKEVIAWVRKDLSPIAAPDLLQWTSGLPKTRSGKIMRRILRKIAENDYAELGDTSTLADPEVVPTLIAERLNK